MLKGHRFKLKAQAKCFSLKCSAKKSVSHCDPTLVSHSLGCRRIYNALLDEALSDVMSTWKLGWKTEECYLGMNT